MPFFFRKSLNSALTKLGQLSVTTCSGNPNYANTLRSCSIVAAAVIEVIVKTSIHFEWESTRSKYECPRNGPKKSNWILDHGRFGHCHGDKGADGGSG